MGRFSVMNINDLEGFKKHKLKEIVKDVYLLDVPISQANAIYKKHAKEPEKQINGVFKALIRDKDGKEFEDLKGKNATEVLGALTLNAIMEGLGKELTPDTKK